MQVILIFLIPILLTAKGFTHQNRCLSWAKNRQKLAGTFDHSSHYLQALLYSVHKKAAFKRELWRLEEATGELPTGTTQSFA